MSVARVVRLEVDLALTLGPLRRGRIDPTMTIGAGEAWRATRTPDGPATQHFRSEGAAVRVRAWGPGARWAIEAAPDLLGARDDPGVFTAHHRLLRDARRRTAGMRIGRSARVVESLVPSIVEQRVTGREAWQSYARLVRRYGEPAPGPAPLLLPPDPALLRDLPYWAYHPLGIERRRADVVRRACAAAVRLEEIATMALTDAYRRLTALPGVGPWTAAEVAKVALGDPDAVSVGDYNLKNVVAWALAGEPRATDERMLELLAPYAGQRQRAIRLIEAFAPRPPRYGPRMPLRAIARI